MSNKTKLRNGRLRSPQDNVGRGRPSQRPQGVSARVPTPLKTGGMFLAAGAALGSVLALPAGTPAAASPARTDIGPVHLTAAVTAGPVSWGASATVVGPGGWGPHFGFATDPTTGRIVVTLGGRVGTPGASVEAGLVPTPTTGFHVVGSVGEGPNAGTVDVGVLENGDLTKAPTITAGVTHDAAENIGGSGVGIAAGAEADNHGQVTPIFAGSAGTPMATVGADVTFTLPTADEIGNGLQNMSNAAAAAAAAEAGLPVPQELQPPLDTQGTPPAQPGTAAGSDAAGATPQQQIDQAFAAFPATGTQSQDLATPQQQIDQAFAAFPATGTQSQDLTTPQQQIDQAFGAVKDQQESSSAVSQMVSPADPTQATNPSTDQQGTSQQGTSQGTSQQGTSQGTSQQGASQQGLSQASSGGAASSGQGTSTSAGNFSTSGNTSGGFTSTTGFTSGGSTSGGFSSTPGAGTSSGNFSS